MESTHDYLSVSGLFWTGNLIPILLITLHFLRESCMPGNFQRRLLLFYSEDSDAKPSEKKMYTQPSVLVYDSGRTHDNQTGLPILDESEDDNFEHFDDIAFEDEHIVIFLEKPGSLQPKTVSAFRLENPKYSGTPFRDVTLAQFVVATFWHCVQMYAFHRAESECILVAGQDHKCKVVVALSFILPCAILLLSLIVCSESIKTATRYPATLSSEAKAWMVKVMHPLIVLGVIYVPIMWCRVAIA